MGAPRRPECNNLLDVFINIKEDEDEHVKTMQACQVGVGAVMRQACRALVYL